MSGSNYPAAGPATPLGINPMTGQLTLPGTNSMSPAFAPGVGTPLPGQVAPQVGQPAPQVAPAQPSQPLPMPPAGPPPAAPPPPQGTPNAAPQVPPQPPSGQPPQAPPAPVDPTTKLLNNYAHYESAGGTQVGNGGGALQFEPAEQKAFEAANPAFAGRPVNTPTYQKAAGTWLTTSNQQSMTGAGVNPALPGANYVAFALGVGPAIAMAKAPDPTADATAFVSKLPGGSALIKGNPALFAGSATIQDVYARADSIQTSGGLPNATQTSGDKGAPVDPSASPPPPGGSPPNPSDAALANLPNAPQLTAAKSNPWLAFASGMLGSHNLAAGLGAGFAGVNAARQGNQQSTNDTALAQQNAALNTANAKITIGKMGAFIPVVGQAGTRTTANGDIFLSKNQFGQEQWQDSSGQIVSPSGQPLQQTLADNRQQGLSDRFNAAAKNAASKQLAGSTVGSNGSANTYTPATVSPPGQPGSPAVAATPALPGSYGPNGQPTSPGQYTPPPAATPGVEASGLQPNAAAKTFAATQGKESSDDVDQIQNQARTAGASLVDLSNLQDSITKNPNVFNQGDLKNRLITTIGTEFGLPSSMWDQNTGTLIPQVMKSLTTGELGDLKEEGGFRFMAGPELRAISGALANQNLTAPSAVQALEVMKRVDARQQYLANLYNNSSSIQALAKVNPQAFATWQTKAVQGMLSGQYGPQLTQVNPFTGQNSPANTGGTPGAPPPGGGVQGAPSIPVLQGFQDMHTLPPGTTKFQVGNTIYNYNPPAQ